ncbi:hypothetical protein F2Q69_00005604 [Brassica cretica]|uniref:Uncharacterized protein n=1 Tax=Brassica cretica TaxID=69181 RepID=A0A8S9PBL0_BRACR|nr:hypothetical protein F2Q69_00005604 [Brassica cretica]
MLSKLPKTPVQPKAHRGPQSTNVKRSNLNPASPDVESSWPASERQNAKSKQVPVVVLPRKAEYGPCEKQNISGSQGTPGPYASPRSKEETQGSPNDFGTPVQPRAHQGHYNFKEAPGSKQQSPDPNLRVPTRPQRPKYKLRKMDRTLVQPRAHRGHYIPKEPPGSHTTSGSKYTRVPIRSPDLNEKPCTTSGSNHNHRNLRVPTNDLRICQRISGFQHRLRSPVLVPGPREETSGSRIKTLWSRINLRAPPRPPGPHATSGLRDHSLDSNSPYSSSKTF